MNISVKNIYCWHQTWYKCFILSTWNHKKALALICIINRKYTDDSSKPLYRHHTVAKLNSDGHMIKEIGNDHKDFGASMRASEALLKMLVHFLRPQLQVHDQMANLCHANKFPKEDEMLHFYVVFVLFRALHEIMYSLCNHCYHQTFFGLTKTT